jgi:hypothetical protein
VTAKLNTMRNPSYLQFIRSRPCSLCGASLVDPHHSIRRLFPISDGGIARKGSDYLSIPLCRRCHGDLHQGSRRIERQELLELIITNLVAFLAGLDKNGK